MSEKQIENKSLTVSEIAEKADVSRSLVWAYIRKNKIKPISKKNNKFRFDSNLVSEIWQKQAKKQEKKSEEVKSDVVFKDVLEILREQLKVKDNQIKEQGETINFLRGEVLRAQLESRKAQKLLEDKREKENAVSADKLKKEKLHWWQRLLRFH